MKKSQLTKEFIKNFNFDVYEDVDYFNDQFIMFDDWAIFSNRKSAIEFLLDLDNKKEKPQIKREQMPSEVLKNRAIAKKFGGYALKGSAKQKEWGEKIRANRISSILSNSNGLLGARPINLSKDEKNKVVTELCIKDSMFNHSKFWIESRDEEIHFFINMIIKQEEYKNYIIDLDFEEAVFSGKHGHIEMAEMLRNKYLKTLNNNEDKKLICELSYFLDTDFWIYNHKKIDSNFIHIAKNLKEIYQNNPENSNGQLFYRTNELFRENGYEY